MAVLRLVWIQCNDLAPGQSLLVQPIFLKATVGPPVRLTADSPKIWLSNAVTPPFGSVGDYIQLKVNGTDLYKSDDYIWDAIANGDTGFVLISDPRSSTNTEYSFTVYYESTANFFLLLRNTITEFAFRVALLFSSIFTLLFKPSRTRLPANSEQTPPSKSQKND